MPPTPLYILAGLVVGGIAAQWVAVRLRVPAIPLLLAAGVLAGPVLGWLDPDALFGDLLDPFVAFAVAFVLFEGGLSLRFEEARKLGWPLLALLLGGLVVTFTSATLLAHALIGLSWATSAVLGAILVVTGPTVIKPMLRHARLRQRPARLLKWEGIVNDPFGALLAVLAFEVALASGEVATPDQPHRSAAAIGLLILTAALVGVVAGRLFGGAMDRGAVPEHLKTPAIFAGVMGVYAGAEVLYHEAGLLAVTAMGVTLANAGSASMEEVKRFKEEFATLLVSMLFLVLSARLELSDLAALTGGALLFVAAVLFLVRPLAVWMSLGFTRLPWREKLLISWVAPRGVVAAAVAAAFQFRLIEAGYDDARLLVPIVFAVILATVVLHGLSMRPIARRLGLASAGEGGLMVIGAASWVIDLSRALHEAGEDLVLVDFNYRNIRQARMQHLEAVRGDVLDIDTLDDLPTEEMSWVLAATDDDHYNSLTSLALTKVVGRENVLQLTPGEGNAAEAHMSGRMPWGEAATFAGLARRYWNGGRFKVTRLSEEFGWQEFRAQNPGALVMFAVHPERMEPVLEGGEAGGPGTKLISLT